MWWSSPLLARLPFLIDSGLWCPARPPAPAYRAPLPLPLPASPCHGVRSTVFEHVGTVSWPWRCQPYPRHLEPCCTQPPAPTPSTPRQRPQPWTAAGPAPAPAPRPKRGTLSPGPKSETPGPGLLPPLAYMPGPEVFPQKPFCPRKTPTRPPAFFPSKNFQTKNPACVAGGARLGSWRRRGGWGWFHRPPGRVARLPMPPPFRGRGGAVSDPGSS